MALMVCRVQPARRASSSCVISPFSKRNLLIRFFNLVFVTDLLPVLEALYLFTKFLFVFDLPTAPRLPINICIISFTNSIIFFTLSQLYFTLIAMYNSQLPFSREWERYPSI